MNRMLFTDDLVLVADLSEKLQVVVSELGSEYDSLNKSKAISSRERQVD